VCPAFLRLVTYAVTLSGRLSVLPAMGLLPPSMPKSILLDRVDSLTWSLEIQNILKQYMRGGIWEGIDAFLM